MFVYVYKCVFLYVRLCVCVCVCVCVCARTYLPRDLNTLNIYAGTCYDRYNYLMNIMGNIC